MAKPNRFVVDGFERACAGIEMRVRVEIIAEYAERLADASLMQRWAIRREMEREIKRRVAGAITAARISPDALY